MANLINKRNKKVGIKLASKPTVPGTWGQEVEPGAGDGFFVLSLSHPQGDRETVSNAGEAGRGMATHGQILGYQAQNGSIDIKAYVEGIEPLIAAVMGSEVDPVEVVTGEVWEKTFPMVENIEDLFWTIAWDEGSEVKCIPSIVFSEWGFRIDKVLVFSFPFMGDKLIKPGFSIPLGVGYTYEGNLTHTLLNCKVYLNDFGGADFQESDRIRPNNIQGTIKRGFEFDGSPEAGSEILSQPTESQEPGGELTLSFPRKDENNKVYFDQFNANTYKKAKIVFDAGQIGTTGQNYEFTINFPKLWIMKSPQFQFESPTQTELTFQIMKAEAAPVGMLYTLPYVKVQNTQNLKYIS